MSKWTGEDEPEPCHRCGSFIDVKKFFVITNGTTCLSGMQLKVSGYPSWGCEPCRAEFEALREGT